MLDNSGDTTDPCGTPTSVFDHSPSSETPACNHFRMSRRRSILIRNARLGEELSLDLQGFQLIRQETAVHDFYDRAEVETIYYPEIEVLLKEATGAEKVVV